MLQEPAGRDLLRAQEYAEIQGTNPHLARDLQLTAEEEGTLLDLLVKQAMEKGELFALMRSGYVGKEFSQLRANHDQEIAALLGDERAQRYREYEASRPFRVQVRTLRGRLDEANALSDAQEARLVSSLQGAQESFKKELQERYAGYDVGQTMSTAYGGSFMTSESLGTPAQEQILEQMVAFNRQLIDSAKDVLTRRQLEVFSHIHEAQLAEQRVRAWRVTNGLE
jgi:hypothetical protein